MEAKDQQASHPRNSAMHRLSKNHLVMVLDKHHRYLSSSHSSQRFKENKRLLKNRVVAD